MNETSKKSKVDKCPSKNKHDKNVIDVQRKCILNEIVPDKIELSNGLVNGITNDLTVKKHGRKSKKNRNGSADINRESITDDKEFSKSKYPELKSNDETHLEEFLHHNNVHVIEESTSKYDVNNVNTVTIKGTKKKKYKVGQIVSSENSNNQECDNALSESRISDLSLKNDLCEKELNKIVQDVNLASSSNKSVHEDSTELISSNNKIEKSDVTDIADSLKKIELNSVNIDSPISIPKIEFIQYENELQMPMIMKIIQKDLSEPYSIYTYRYFIHNWPKLCFLVSINYFLYNKLNKV